MGNSVNFCNQILSEKLEMHRANAKFMTLNDTANENKNYLRSFTTGYKKYFKTKRCRYCRWIIYRCFCPKVRVNWSKIRTVLVAFFFLMNKTFSFRNLYRIVMW